MRCYGSWTPLLRFGFRVLIMALVVWIGAGAQKSQGRNSKAEKVRLDHVQVLSVLIGVILGGYRFFPGKLQGSQVESLSRCLLQADGLREMDANTWDLVCSDQNLQGAYLADVIAR